MKTSKKKKMLLSAIAIVLLWTIVGLTLAFRLNVNMYTTEQHINRISKRLEKTYIIQSGKYTDYKVYPLYNADGDDKYEYSVKNWLGINEKYKKRYFLVEFEPKGFEIVKAEGEILFGMYKSRLYGVWSRYRISQQRPDDSDGIRWERTKPDGSILDGWEQIIYDYGDSNIDYDEILANIDNIPTDVLEQIIPGFGNSFNDERWHYWDEYDDGKVLHNESPYRAANIGQEEKKYLLPIGGKGDMTHYFIPAVKRGDKFLNLISMEEFYYDSNATWETMPCRQVFFYEQYNIAIYL